MRSRKSFFLLLKRFVDGVALLLVMTLKCENSAFFGRHLVFPIAVQEQLQKTQAGLAVSQNCISICLYFCTEILCIAVSDNCSCSPHLAMY